MAEGRRVNVRAILADKDLRRALMVPTIQAIQAREGIETTREQAERAYYVVTEAERAAFFALEPFKAGRRGEPDRRHDEFVRALRSDSSVRSDIARRDFSVIEGMPLAYDRVGLLAKVFKEYEAVEPHHAKAHQGVIFRPDEPYIRCHWEVAPRRADRPWVTLHKGGGFSRFYYDSELVADWSDKAQGEFHRLRDTAIYFKRGLTWPRRTQKGFNLRRLPSGCVFSDKGPSVFFESVEMEDYFLGLANSLFAEYVMRTLMSFGSWELTVVRRFPLAQGTEQQKARIAQLAVSIHDIKAAWDVGNEISTRFETPWLLRPEVIALETIAARLDALAQMEMEQEQTIQVAFAAIDEAVFEIYRIPKATQETVRKSLPDRVGEVLWADMDGKSMEQKRAEHVWRLLSYIVKRVIEADDDGVVPFGRAGGDAPLIDRVRQELAGLFAGRDESQLEVEIVNELKRGAKGYRKCSSLEDWIANAFFAYHASLYKNRPIFWHIASTQGTAPFAFGALVHYHRFDKNRIAKLRASYVRDTIEEYRREAALADKANRAEDRVELQARVEEAQALDKMLRLIQEGHHEGPEGGDLDFRILTPWKEPDARPKGWNPDLDDGVKVNIGPFDRAGVLRVSGVGG